MYPPQQQPKMPIPIRPRSSLSTDEHHHRMKDSSHHLHRKPSNAVLTLAGFCIFLLVLCVFLLGALVYVGRNIVNERHKTGLFLRSDFFLLIELIRNCGCCVFVGMIQKLITSIDNLFEMDAMVKVYNKE